MNKQAKWIKAPETMPENVSPKFSKSIILDKPVKKAVAHISAIGVYNFYVNGEKIGDFVLAPGWTSSKRVQYQSYNVTEYLTNKAEFSVLLGRGWANGHVGLGEIARTTTVYPNMAMICHVEITYADGSVENIFSDESWDVYTSHILYSEIYHGETVDMTANIEKVGSAVLYDGKKPRLVKQVGEIICERERVAPVKLIKTPLGESVIDFGQNLAGYVEIKIKGKRGEKIVITHAEVLDKDGNFYTDNMRRARNTNMYILSGENDIFKPSFCFQGYRYIRLDEFPDQEIDVSCFTSVAVYSNIKRTGDFECGNEKINQLYSNIIWGQRSNFLDVPTDCPQRDERMGWTGDAEVFCRTAAINFDVEKFFEKWLGDMALDQYSDGGINGIIPVWQNKEKVSTAWGDAAVICPWEIYRAYGSKELLKKSYPMMKKWIEFMHNFGDEEFLFLGGNHYGDWLAKDIPGGHRDIGATQTDLIASAYFAFSLSIMIKTAKILGEDASYFENMHKNVRRAFRNTFMKDGLPCMLEKYDAVNRTKVNNMTQTAIVLILRFGLFEENERQILLDKLQELIRDFDGRMTTGFVGTPHILHVLTENGLTDLAYDLLFQEKAPSWLYSVNHGATTIWEHWDGLKEDGTFQSKSMNSFNHYAYGSVYDWIFGKALGIDVCDDGAGYTRITVAPHPEKRLGFARGSIDSRCGKISSSWRYLSDGTVRYEITVPEKTTAAICIKGLPEKTVSGGTYVFHA